MSAAFKWEQSVGVATHTVLEASGNLFNFKNIDSIGISDYVNYPIPAGANSFEVWLRAQFSGTFASIYDLRFWMSTNFSPNTGLVIKANTQQVDYGTPTSATSSIATSILGTSDPGARNVSYGGSLTSSISSSAYTDYIVLQLQTLSTAAAGDTSLATFSLSYIET